MRLQRCIVVTDSYRLLIVSLFLLLTLPIRCVSCQFLFAHNSLVGSHNLGSQDYHHNLEQTQEESSQGHMKSTTSQSDPRPQHTEPAETSEQARAFPYQFENIALAAAKNPVVKLGTPYTIKGAHVAQDRVGLQEVALEAENVILPSRDDGEHGFKHQLMRPIHHRRPFLTKTELDFLGILAAILLKLSVSTALATWFLAAGQVLYGLANITGTTAVFGMDSSIRYIYKTLPFIEALLRGETVFT